MLVTFTNLLLCKFNCNMFYEWVFNVNKKKNRREADFYWVSKVGDLLFQCSMNRLDDRLQRQIFPSSASSSCSSLG